MGKPTDLILDSMDQSQFCLRVLAEFPAEFDAEILADPRIERIRRHMFINQGWRLTHRGFQLLSRHHRAYASKNTANEKLTGRMLLAMDHCVRGPWFMRGSWVHVFDARIHLELEIMGGDVSAFVDFRVPR